MEERTDPRLMRPAPHHLPVEETFDDVAQVIDLRRLEERAAGYRGDDVETDRSKTSVYIRASGDAATVVAMPAAKQRPAKPVAEPSRATRRTQPLRRQETPGPTIRRSHTTQRLMLPAVGAHGFAELEPTQFIPRARPLAWPSPSGWALVGMAVVTLLSVGACAALILLRI